MTDVVEAQRREIIALRGRCMEVTQDLCDQIQVNSNLSHVLAYLTDGKFKEFASENNWNRVITDYLESE